MTLTTYRSPNGQTFQLSADAVPVVEPFFNRLNQVYPGYQSAGGYAHRPMRTLDGRNLGGLSTHATGYTLDVKAPDPVLRQMAQEFPHLKWGGKFSHYDPVHFEFGPTAQKYGELPPLNPASLLDPNAAAPTPGPQPPAIAPSGGAAPMTPMQPMTPYSGPSPDDVAQQRRMAQMLMQQATSTEPVGHWTQALARVVQGGVGGMYRNAAQEGERQGREAISSALGGTLTPAAAASNPWLGDLGLQMYKQQSSATPLVIPEGATAIVPDKANPGQFKPLTVGQPKRSPDMQNYQEYAQGEQAAGRQPMSFMEYQLKLRQAGATAITNDMRGENAEAAGIGQGAAKRANDTLDRARAASTTIRRMVDLQTRLDQIDTGKLAPGMATIGAWAKGVGVSDETLATMGIDPKLPGTAESIKAVTGRMVVDMIGAGGFPANNFSDADRAFLLETVPRLANTPLGNRLIIEAAKRAAAVDVEKGKALQEWRRNNKGKSVDDFELEWSDRTARMDLMGDLRQEAEKLVAQSGGQRADTRSLPRVNSPAEAARLPKGTEFIDPQGNIRKVP